MHIYCKQTYIKFIEKGDGFMFYPKRDETADKENKKMKKIMKAILNDKKIKESDILNLIGKQKIN